MAIYYGKSKINDINMVGSKKDKILLNKKNLHLIGNTIVDENDYNNDKILCKSGKLRIKINDEYHSFEIPQLNKVNDEIYDELENLIFTKRVQTVKVDENTIIYGGRGVNYSESFLSDSDNQFWFMIYLTPMGLPDTIRDSGKIYSKYPYLTNWTKKEVGVSACFAGLICVHLDLSWFGSDTVPTTREEFTQYLADHPEKHFNIYYEMATPVITELKNELLVVDKDSSISIFDNAFDESLNKNIVADSSLNDQLSIINNINNNFVDIKRCYYSNEFGCYYSDKASTCSGAAGDNFVIVNHLDELDFEVGHGVAIENARAIRNPEEYPIENQHRSWLCCGITYIDYAENKVYLNRTLQFDVTNVAFEHDNFYNYQVINNFFFDKEYVNLKFEPGTYLCHYLRSTYDTLATILSDYGIKHNAFEDKIQISFADKRFVDIDFQGSVFKECAKWFNMADSTFGGPRCSVIPYGLLAVVGCDKVTVKNATFLYDSEKNCTWYSSTGENMGDGFLFSGCVDLLAENLESVGCESDGFIVDGHTSSFYAGKGDRGSKNVILKNCRAYSCGRQGLTWSSGCDGIIDNCDFSYTGFTRDGSTKAWWGNRNPGAGIDFEFESYSDTTTGWLATSAIRRVKVTRTKLTYNNYALANGMTEGNFLIENSIIVGNPKGVFLIKTGNNAGFGMRQEEDEPAPPYVFGTMQPMTCVLRDCMIDPNGVPNKSAFGFFRRVIFDNCTLKNFFFDYGGRQVSIINSDLQYTDGSPTHMQGYPRFPLIQNCTIRFRQAFVDNFAQWAKTPIYGQFEDCTFFLEEPSEPFTEAKTLLIDFGTNSKRNYVYPAAGYNFDGSSNNGGIIKIPTKDWGNRDCYEVYSAKESIATSVLQNDKVVTNNGFYIQDEPVKTNFIIDENFVLPANAKGKVTVFLRANELDHYITFSPNRTASITGVYFKFWAAPKYVFANGSTVDYTYTIPEELSNRPFTLHVVHDKFNPLCIDIKLITNEGSIFDTVEVPVTINLDVTSSTLAVGDTLQLNAIATPADVVLTYTSDTEDIASVDSSTGLITALAVGTATITVTDTNNKSSKTCTITVE